MIQENRPLVTAAIPVYNHEKYVEESIRSIIAQTYQNIELIVINDGSKDQSHERILPLIPECRQRFVRFEYVNRENVGISASLNQALNWARGNYLTALASDDVALPEKVEVLVNALEENWPTYAAAFGNAWFIDDAGQRVSLDKDGRISGSAAGELYDNVVSLYTKDRHIDCRGKDFGTYKTLIMGNYLPAMSNLVRTSAVSEAEGWTPGNPVEDWEMWLKLAKKLKFVYVDQPVALYRCHATNTSRTAADGLAYSLLRVLHQEKNFCAANELTNLWQRTAAILTYDLMLQRGFPFSNKVGILKASDKWSLLKFVVSRILRRLGVQDTLH